ncbi:MAG: hypothetical protein ACK46X_02670 [Candidatus Sericytochromatia bacterium]
MAEQDPTNTRQTSEPEKNKYAHVLELARAKKISRGELEPDRRPSHPPSNWAPPPSGE